MFNPKWNSCAQSIIREVTGEEKGALLRHLKSEWAVDHYWFPLREKTGARSDVTQAFQADYFEEELTHETLRGIFEVRGVTTMFEKREEGRMCEIELAQFHPVYMGSEGFWFSAQLDWAIYASHESSVTVGGAWLLPAVQAAWPNWKQRIWTTWDYERPPLTPDV